MTATKTTKQGDRVAVPWGVSDVVGTVLEVYGPPRHRYALVRVPTRGPAGETLEEAEISYPESALRPVTAAQATPGVHDRHSAARGWHESLATE